MALVLRKTGPPSEHGYSYNGNGHNADSLPPAGYGAANRRSRLYWPPATAWHPPKGNSPCSPGPSSWSRSQSSPRSAAASLFEWALTVEQEREEEELVGPGR